MALRLAIAFLLSFVFAGAHAQDLTVEVKNRDKQPLAFAYVNIYNGTANTGLPRTTVLTDDNGKATVTISKLPFTLEVVAMGYEAVVYKYNSFPEEGYVTTELVKKISSLNEVVVTGVANPTKLKDALSVYQVITKITLSGVMLPSTGSLPFRQLIRVLIK